ncbi:MAG TPA: tripartite tricarboxylate transporter substrate binding protein [Xanthobacteraceae bacterium]
MLVAAVLAGPLADPATAQRYPIKTIKLIVPFGPGGPTDLVARLASQIVQGALGQSVIVENRPGAGGATGTRSVAGADPDGYTLLLGTVATLGALPAAIKDPGFDPISSFAPIAKLSESTAILVVPQAFPANTVGALVSYAKAHAGQLNYASAGVGNQTHLNAEVFKAKAGIDIVHVPYKSGAEMVTAVLTNQVQVAFLDISVVLPLIKEGKLKPLAVTAAHRHPALPNVPTMIESGIDSYVATFWTGVVAPSGTSSAIVETLNDVINAGLHTPSMREALERIGAAPSPTSPSEFKAFIAAEYKKWKDAVLLAGISAE